MKPDETPQQSSSESEEKEAFEKAQKKEDAPLETSTNAPDANQEPCIESSAPISVDLQDLISKFEQRMKNRASEEEERDKKPEGESTLERLERQLREKDAILRKYIVGHKEAVVQFEQSRNRLQKDVKNQVNLFTRKFLEDLLDVVDNLDRAMESFEKDPNAEGFFEGVGMVRTQFLQKLKKNDVERMDSLNAPFDPLRHEAISTVPVEDDEQDSTIVGIVKEGYTIGEDVLRPATVAVGKFKRSKTL